MSASIDNIEKITKIEYLIMFFVICISGNPLFIYAESKMLYVISTALMIILCFIKCKQLSNNKLLFWLLSSCILFTFQNFILTLTSVSAEINFLLRLSTAFMVASYLGYKFREIYFKVMVFICAISIPLYILQLDGISVGYEIDRYKSILVYNFMIGTRNPGMFWEPGALQGFIMLIPLFYSNKLKELWETHKRECIILLITLLTTKSTTGYLTLAVFLFLTLLLNAKIRPVHRGLAITVILAVFGFAWSQDFMGEKIMKEYEEMRSIQQGDISWNRMGAMIIDIQNITRHPIIGNGFMDESRYGILGEYMRGAGNGLTGTINILGIPFILLFFTGIYRNLSHIPKANRLVFIFAIMLILTGEYMLNYPLFWSLLFIKFPQDERTIGTINCTQP